MKKPLTKANSNKRNFRRATGKKIFSANCQTCIKPTALA